MRSPDPAAAARAFVAAGRDPVDLAAGARAPFVKICGVTDAAGILAAVRAGADAIGLNFAPGTPRALTIDEGAELARLARGRGGGAAAPQVVARHGGPARRRRCRGSSRASTPTRSSSAATSRRPRSRLRPAGLEGAARQPERRAGRGGRARPGPTSRPARPGSCSTRPAGRIRAGPACASTPAWRPRSPARSRSRWPAACTPVTWLTRCSRSRRSAWTSPRARTRRASDGRRPRKDPLRVAVFAKRARDARRHRPNVAFRPDARPRRPARGRRRGPLGQGARLRRPLRAGDADRRA